MSSTGQPDLISLAVGWPSPRLYPTDELARITADVFAEEGGEALSYLPAEGLYAFREQLAARGRAHGFAEDLDEIIVTSGAKQGISLAARATLEPGDVAVIESPSFAGMLDSLRQTGARVIGVPVDQDGFDVDALERLLARHEVKLVALQTACQNPTGRDLSEERRARLAALARERNFFVLEDRVYADASFGGKPVRPLRELAPAHVIYVNSLSKLVGGGLRAGWVAASGPVRERIATLKLEADFHSATLIQHIAARWLAAGAYDRHLEHTAAVLPRAPRRPARGPRAPHARRVPGRPAAGRPPRVGDAEQAARRARAVRRGGAARRGLHAGRRGDGRAAHADVAPPVVLAGGAAGAGRGREAARPRDPRGAPKRSPRGGRADVLAAAAPRASARARRACAARPARSGRGRARARRRDGCAAPRRTARGPPG